MKFEGIIRSIQNIPDNRNISYEDYFYKRSMGSFITLLKQVKLLSIIQDGTVCRNMKPSGQEQRGRRNISNEEHGSICYPIETRHKQRTILVFDYAIVQEPKVQ